MIESWPVSERNDQLPGDVEHRASLQSEAAALESIVLLPPQLTELSLMLNGAFHPLSGFMNEADYVSVLESLRLTDGTAFPWPVALGVDLTTARAMKPGQRVALRDGEGLAYAVLRVESVWRRNASLEHQVTGAEAEANEQHSCLVGGKVEGIRLPAHPFYARLRPGPAALQDRIRQRGYSRVLAVDGGPAIHRHDHALITRTAAELDAAVLLHPAIGPPDPDDRDQVVKIKCHIAALSRFSAATTLLALLDNPAPWRGVRGFLMHAFMRKRFGATHFMMKGVSQRMIDSDPRVAGILDDIGIRAVDWPDSRFALSRGDSDRAGSGAAGEWPADDHELIESIRQGAEIPADHAFPEVLAVLERHYRPTTQKGFTIFFTGLSGSGKSTIAKIVQARVAEQDPRPVTLLDGDIVRRRFSRDLGFSRQDRDTNVRRIGAAAADITQRGGVAICCPIAPYADTRKAVRSMIEPHGEMIEVHISTPVEVCEQRDPKGLYKKARQGKIENFTGVSDPYEAPEEPEIRIDASTGTPDAAADRLMGYLERSGLIPGGVGR